MTFQPRMNNRISGFEAVGAWTRRVFGDVVADLWSVTCASSAGGLYVAEDPRLFVVLETAGTRDRSITMRRPAEAGLRQAPCRRLSYIPAGMELMAEMQGVRSIRHLDLHLDIAALGRRLGEDLDPARLHEPRLMIADPGLVALSERLAAECAAREPLHELYGDSLALALFVAMMRIPPAARRTRGDLAPWQLRRVTEFIEAHCLRGIRLEELAALTGLSSSHFSQAFKASTGLPPHQWQMRARIERAKTMLATGGGRLSDVAVETGFSDQAHFTRAFRKVAGTTPGQWLRSRRA